MRSSVSHTQIEEFMSTESNREQPQAPAGEEPLGDASAEAITPEQERLVKGGLRAAQTDGGKREPGVQTN